MKYITTKWELAAYDVLGNAKDGYDINGIYRRGTVELRLAVETCNPGTAQEFVTAYPTDRQIRQAFGLGKIQLELSGDDCAIYINRRRDGYPIGEMLCASHDSLSPIREKAGVQ